ncbi:DNA helicase PcrA [Halonatronum saccharophilum]|uniref:DNA helicase PcrA n=1 Tax=Halonatronum saccharophilum TaxID=150060 RepID=UPI0004883363|nr:DNA helicase PcrA [Halonatronum saccharophilum]
MDILSDLNDKQQEAAIHNIGPLLILAGAGSGKTRVLTYRVANLIYEYGVSPVNILAVTFTNKAANEMKERVEKLVDKDSKGMWISTFHSICVRILRREIKKVGYESNFVIFDTADQRTLIKNILKDLDIDPKKFNPRAILGSISSAKNQLISAQDYEENNYFESTVAGVYREYQKRLRANNALDFDDLIMKTVELFEEYPLVLDHYQERFKYIMVDEYQDVNYAQYRLVSLLAQKYRNICVVGDDDQGIYGFRGADITNILSFEQDYPDTKVIKLEQNYRSTKVILDAAFNVVSNNLDRKEKRLWTDNDKGHPLTLYKASSGSDEAKYLCSQIKELKEEEGYKFSDFSILYRTNAQSRVLEATLMKERIPYKIVGGLKFYDRKEIKDILAYLRVIYNPEDQLSLERIINVPKRGIGSTTVGRLKDFAQEEGINLLDAIYIVDQISTISSRFANKVRGFGELIEELKGVAKENDVLSLTEEVLKRSGYKKQLELENTIEAQTRLENIKELLASMEEFISGEVEASLEEYLEDVALTSDIDKLDEQADAILLMTLHSAKGLEFPVVFLVGMEEELFPHIRSLESQEDIAEERRLCYVGITRAQERLYLTHATYRKVYGSVQYNRPSRFLAEIPEDLFRGDEEIKVEEVVEKKGYDFGLGDRVIHQSWGQGTVISFDKSDGLEKVTVAFPEKGVKELALEYVKLKKI